MISESKLRRLRALSTPDGIIAALAIDQRKSMRRMMADAADVPLEQISDGQLQEFKTAVVRALTPHASAVLLDTDYGLPAAKARAPGCGLLLTYEVDGYENPRPHKMLALQPRLSVSRLRDLGADGVKILLTYSPFDDLSANDEKHALIERIGAECAGLDMPFFLEPVGYDPGGLDPKSFEYAQSQPEIVIAMLREFSNPVYQVDILKVEFPVNAAFVQGNKSCTGQTAFSREEALAIHREADAAASLPYIFLSAGVSSEQFAHQLELAAAAESRYSGVLCGRATWQDGAVAFARGGLGALEAWLATEGTRKICAVNQAVQPAKSWLGVQ